MANQNDASLGWEPSGIDSSNCIDIWLDGPSDTPLRPCPSHLLPIFLAERDKLIRWGVSLPPLPPHIEQMLREQSPPS